MHKLCLFKQFYNILVVTLSFSVHVFPENYWKYYKFLAPKKWRHFLFLNFFRYHIINIVTIYEYDPLVLLLGSGIAVVGGGGALSPFEKSMEGTGSRPTLEMQDGPLRYYW